MHEASQGAIYQYIIGKSMMRQKDPVAQSLMAQLVEDYKVMTHGKNGKFFTDRDRGILPFMIKYIHYCMYGLDLSKDKMKMDIVYEFYYGNALGTASLYYIKVVGTILNVTGQFKFSRLLNKVAKIYEESPSLESYPEVNPAYMNLSRKEVAHSSIPIMAIAATVGPKHLLGAAMGYKPFPNQIDGVKTGDIDVTTIWDSINLNDKSEVERYIYECGRLWVPVGHTRESCLIINTTMILLRFEYLTLPFLFHYRSRGN